MDRRLRQLCAFWRRARLRFADPCRRADLLREQGVKVGQGCRILTSDFGSEPYLISIGDETLISSAVSFITHDAGTWGEFHRSMQHRLWSCVDREVA